MTKEQIIENDLLPKASSIKIKKTRVPKSAESITAGAMKLSLADRVALVKVLQESIGYEVKTLQLQAAEAEKIANGTNQVDDAYEYNGLLETMPSLLKK